MSPLFAFLFFLRWRCALYFNSDIFVFWFTGKGRDALTVTHVLRFVHFGN